MVQRHPCTQLPGLVYERVRRAQGEDDVASDCWQVRVPSQPISASHNAPEPAA